MGTCDAPFKDDDFETIGRGRIEFLPSLHAMRATARTQQMMPRILQEQQWLPPRRRIGILINA